MAGVLPAVQLRTLAWFTLIGFIGFLVDAGILHLLVAAWDTNLFLGRACSFTCAATTTWLINRLVTFSSRQRHPFGLLGEWAAYFVASLGGGCLNYLVFVIAVRVSPLLHHTPSIAVALGSLAGTTFNFVVYARYVFRTHAQAAGGPDV